VGKISRCLLVTLLLLVVGIVHLWTLRPGQNWGGDFSMYMQQAKNLAEGLPYSTTGYIYNPGYATIGPPTYPPVCPLLLAPVYMVAGLDYEAMKLAMVASLVFSLLFMFLIFRKELSYWPSLAIVALVGFNRCFLGDANSIGSDLPFMALLYLTIFLIQKAYDTQAYDTQAADPPRLGYLLPAALLIFASYSARTVGIVLLPAVLLYDLLRYRRITLPAVLSVVVFGTAAVAQSLLMKSTDASYLDQYNVGPGVFLHNAMCYVMELAAFWHNAYFKLPGAILAAIITALALWGYVASVRRKVTVLEIFPVLYVIAVLLFPGYAGRRYLQPIFPIYLYFAAQGLRQVWLMRNAAIRRTVFAVLLLGITVSYAASFTRLELEVTEGATKPESMAMFDFIIKQTDPDDVMIFIKPRVMALLTERRTSVYHMPSEDSQLWDYFDQIGAGYIVVVENAAAFEGAESPARIEYLRDFATRNAKHLTPIFNNADFRIYKIKGRGGGER
jgi:hypothetical protein